MKKSTRKLFVAALLAGAIIAPIFAQVIIKIDPEIMARQVSETGRKQEVADAKNEIITQWFRHRYYLEKKDYEQAEKALEDIFAVSQKAMVDESQLLSLALLYEGYMFFEMSDYASAQQAFDNALEFNPTLYQARQAKARTYFNQNPYNIFPYVAEMMYALKDRFGDVWGAYFFGFNLFATLFLTAAAWASAALFIGILRNFSLVYHEFKERCLRIFPKDAAVLLAGGIIFLPLFLWLGPLWLILFWIILFWRYFSVFERFAALVLIALLILIVPATSLAKHLVLTASDPEALASISAITGEYDEERIRILKNLFEKDPQNHSVAFTLGMLYKNGGYADEARQYFLRTIKIKPDYIQAYINIGNIYFRSSEFYEAIRNYKEANKIKPTALAYFNMYTAYNHLFLFTEATAAFDEATLIDSFAVAEYTRKGDIVDAYPETGNIISQFTRLKKPGMDETSSVLFSAQTFFTPYSFLAICALAGIALYGYLTRLTPRAISCVKCGRPFCNRCRVGLESESYCSQCGHLFIKKEAVSPAIRGKKLYEVERFQRRKRLVGHFLDFVLPGSGLLYGQRLVYGGMIVFIWALGISIILGQRWFLWSPTAIVVSFNIFPLYLGGIMIAFSWFVANPYKWFFFRRIF